MNRFTNSPFKSDELHYSAWLVADSAGGLKMTRGEPTTGRGEIAVQLTVKVPKALFRKPLLKAVVTVPPMSGVSEESAIRAVADVIQQGCGYMVDVEPKAG